MAFTKATKTQCRLRLALCGTAGSGKTFTALNVAKFLGGRTALIDSERGSASKYADLFDFDTDMLGCYSPETYIKAIQAAGAAGYDNCIIDGLSQAWAGKDGALEMVDKAAARQRTENRFTAWRDVTPIHNQLVDTMLTSPCHLIATMRCKTDYVMEKDPTTGKTKPKKVGMAPVQRDGMEYEFDVVGDLDTENVLVVSKTRCYMLRQIDAGVFPQPGEKFAGILKAWLSDGVAISNSPLVRAFADLGVSEAMIVGYLKHPVATASPEETEKLRGAFGTIKAGKMTWNEFVTPPMPNINSLDDVKKALEQGMEQAKSQTIFDETRSEIGLMLKERSLPIDSLRVAMASVGCTADQINLGTHSMTQAQGVALLKYLKEMK